MARWVDLFRAWLASGKSAAIVGLVAIASVVAGVSTHTVANRGKTSYVLHTPRADVQPGVFVSSAFSLSKFQVFDVRASGATGNCSSDDSAAINAADAAAKAVGGIVFFPSPAGACYCVNSGLNPTAQAWYGYARQIGQTIIRSCAAMYATVSVHYTQNNSIIAATPFWMSGLTIDANLLAKHAIARRGDFFSHYENVFTENAAVSGGQGGDCIFGAPFLNTYQFSATSIPSSGSSPTITIAQRDPDYVGLNAASTTVQLQITATGALQAATYAANFNSGGLATVSQNVAAKSNLVLTSGASLLYDSGIQITFPAGTYANGDTYGPWTVTVPNGDGQLPINNSDAVFDNVWTENCGAEAASSGITGFPPVQITVPGTVTTPAVACAGTGCVVTGLGTQFITQGIGRPGDFGFVTGAGIFPMSAVEDDLHYVIQRGIQPTNVAGATYAIGQGAGFFEGDFGDMVRDWYVNVHTFNVPTGLRVAGNSTGGPFIVNGRFETHSFAGISAGGLTVPTNGLEAHHNEFKVTSAPGEVSLYLTPTQNGGTIIEPQQFFTVGGTGYANIKTNGGETAYGQQIPQSSAIPFWSESGSITQVALATGAEVIPLPDQGLARVHSSLVELQPSANVTMTSSTPIASCAGAVNNGLYIRLVNVNPSTVTIPNTGNNLRMIQPYTLGQYQSLDFFCDSFTQWILIHASAPTGPATTSISFTTGNNTLTTAQTSVAVHRYNATLTGALTVNYPNAFGYWIVDTNNLTLGANTATVTCGTGTFNLAANKVYTMVCYGSNVLHISGG